jgi:hypothetical protein
MNFRFGAYVGMMFGLAMLVTACGGGGGGGGFFFPPTGGGGTVVTPITVTAAKNPVLINTPVTVTANFTNYTSTTRFGTNKATVGSPVHFTAPATATLSNQTAIKADFTATVDVTAPAGKYAVSVSYNNSAGSTAITFIPQPVSASVVVTSPKALNGLGGIQCDVTSDMPAVFRKYSTAVPNVLSSGNPLPTSLPLSVTTVTPILATGSAAGFNIAANSTIISKLFYDLSAVIGVPNFTIGNVQATTSTPPIVLITPTPVLTMQPVYFSGPNGTGTQLYP